MKTETIPHMPVPEGLDFNVANIPGELDQKYHGCGNGQATFSPDGELINIDYTDSRGRVIAGQNIMMCDDAGLLLSTDANGNKTYRANFSCYQVCLF